MKEQHDRPALVGTVLGLVWVAVLIVALLVACNGGGNGDGWTEAQKDSLTDVALDAKLTPSQARCVVRYAVSHWTAAEVMDGSDRAAAHGREAGLACR